MRSDSVTAALKDMRQTVAAPRAAAVAGVIFAALLIVSLGLVRLAVPADPSAPGSWLIDPERRSALRVALNLVPFAGIAFLWFVGVIRSRLGTQEDQFLSTVLLAVAGCSSHVYLELRRWRVGSPTPSPTDAFSYPKARRTTLVGIRPTCS